MHEGEKDFSHVEKKTYVAKTERGVVYSTDERAELSVDERKEEGREIFRDHLERVEGQYKALVFSLENLRRDLELTQKSDSSVKVSAGNLHRTFVTPAINEGQTFSAMVEGLTRAIPTLDVSVSVPRGGSAASLEKASRELLFIHENLAKIAVIAQNMHKVLMQASLRFSQFNGDNAGSYDSANIAYDMDSLNLAATLSRSIAERSVRLDIDIVSLQSSVPAAEPHASRMPA